MFDLRVCLFCCFLLPITLSSVVDDDDDDGVNRKGLRLFLPVTAIVVVAVAVEAM